MVFAVGAAISAATMDLGKCTVMFVHSLDMVETPVALLSIDVATLLSGATASVFETKRKG